MFRPSQIRQAQSLHAQALKVSSDYRKAEAELFEIMFEMDQLKGFLALGYSSLYEYAVHGLKLSESQAAAFHVVVRRSIFVPELKQKIEEGKLSIAKARRITSVLHSGNKDVWLEKAETLTHRELEREVRKISPRTPVLDMATYASDKRVDLQLSISEEVYAELQTTLNLMSQRLGKNASMEEALQEALREFNDRHDPVRKAERVLAKQQKKVELQNEAEPMTPIDSGIEDSKISGTCQIRKPIPARNLHLVNARDRGSCQFIRPDGQRCGRRRFLHTHHILPVALGGSNATENLTIYCSNHHHLWHLQQMPISFELEAFSDAIRGSSTSLPQE